MPSDTIALVDRGADAHLVRPSPGGVGVRGMRSRRRHTLAPLQSVSGLFVPVVPGIAEPRGGAPVTLPIVIIDDHELVAWSLACSLRSEGLKARFDPVRSASGVLESAGRVRAGIALLDLALGRDERGDPIDGVALVAPLCSAGWRVLVLTGSASRSRLGAALDVGAFGWVSKSSPFPTLLLAIREALAGRSTTSPSRRRELIDLNHRDERDHHQLVAKMETLTVREREVLVQLAHGHRAHAIAEGATVSTATVRTQVHAMLAKLEVTSQLEAVALYRRAQHGRAGVT